MLDLRRSRKINSTINGGYNDILTRNAHYEQWICCQSVGLAHSVMSKRISWRYSSRVTLTSTLKKGLPTSVHLLIDAPL